MTWRINQTSKPKIQNPILIEGLPGIGNVGKIATDFLIDSLRAKKIFEITSYNFPNWVYINEDNLVELPTIEVFYKNIKGKTLLLLSGDMQPIDEISCYEFCDQILDILSEQKGKKEIITLGGIALDRNIKNPKLYATANEKKIREKYAKKFLNNNMYGMVGPIIGVSGILVGLAGKRKIPAVSLLVETYGHPNHLGLRSAREIIKLLNEKLRLNLSLKEINQEIKNIESEDFSLGRESNSNRIKKLKKGTLQPKDINYIG